MMGALLLVMMLLGIPSTEILWQQCCAERDCVEADVEVLHFGEDESQVRIGLDTVWVLNARIHPSMDGREYYCVYDQGDPTREEIICIFHASPLAKGHA